MGSAQSYISPESALTTLVVAGAIGLGYTQIGRSSTSTAVKNSTDATPQPDKGKKKRAKSNVAFSGDSSDKGHSNNDKSQQHPTTPRVPNPLPGFPGQFEPTTSPDSHPSEVAATSSSSKAKKPKKKKAKAAVTTDPIVREVAASSADYSSEISNKSRTKTPKRQQQPQSSSEMTRPFESTASVDTDGSWTRVGSVRRHTALSKNSTASFEATTSDADTGLTPQTGDSSPITERGTEGEESSSFLLDIGSRESGENPRKTLAEKLLPKPRKTGVDELSFFNPPCLA